MYEYYTVEYRNKLHFPIQKRSVGRTDGPSVDHIRMHLSYSFAEEACTKERMFYHVHLEEEEEKEEEEEESEIHYTSVSRKIFLFFERFSLGADYAHSLANQSS